jgi:hypothetical protein
MKAQKVFENLDFERSGDINKSLNVGIYRKMSKEILKEKIYDDIWPKIKDDFFYREIMSEAELKFDLIGLIDVMIENGIERPSEFGVELFKDYFTDVHKVNEALKTSDVIEDLEDQEHDSWSRWMKYVF